MSQKKSIVTKKRQKYSSQFREQAVARAKKDGVPKAAKDLGIHEAMLYSWRKKFDDKRLDTLFLTMPISWHGTLAQYAGRLHRTHAHKKEVVIYDYVDSQVVMLAKMAEKRLKGYSKIGYTT